MKYFWIVISCFFFCEGVTQSTNPFEIPGKQEEQVPMEEQVSSITSDTGTYVAADTVNTGIIQEPLDTSSATLLDSDASAIQTTDLIDNPFELNTQNYLPESSTSNSGESESPIIDSNAEVHQSNLGSEKFNIIVLVFSLVMLIIGTLAISLNKSRFSTMLKACINSNAIRSLEREPQTWMNGQSIILYAMFFLNAGFFIWLFLSKNESTVAPHLFWIVLAVIGCYFIRHLILGLIGWVYPLGSSVGLHNFSISIHNQVLGIIIIPFILALEFIPWISVGKIALICAFFAFVIYGLRQLKGFFLCVGNRGFNPFYFFVYLCAIEIAPILVAYKMIIGAL